MPGPSPITAAAERAVAYLEEISPEMRGCAVLGAGGEVLAASAGDRDGWQEAARGLLAAADAAGGERASHVHVATSEGEAFCVREGEQALVAVTQRFVLASLMVFDMRAALRLAAAGAAA